jgi:hypothetical protein
MTPESNNGGDLKITPERNIMDIKVILTILGEVICVIARRL